MLSEGDKVRKKISQAEAHGLRAQVKALKAIEARRREVWNRDYPGGVNIATLLISDIDTAKINTARRLGCMIVLTKYNSNQASVYAVKP